MLTLMDENALLQNLKMIRDKFFIYSKGKNKGEKNK